MTRWGQALRRLVFPKHCFLCNQAILPHQRLCENCALSAPVVFPPLCERCGRGANRCVCGGRRRSFERSVSAFYYEGVVKSGINTLKTGDYAVTVDGFADEMAEIVRREYGGIVFDLITAVPMHSSEYRQRGFDQAARLAKAVADRLAIPFIPTLKKCYRTVPQKELKSIQRSGNLLGVFDVVADVAGRTVLLVDDVITTGATLEECAKMLKIYGAEEVYAITAAAAVLKTEPQ